MKKTGRILFNIIFVLALVVLLQGGLTALAADGPAGTPLYTVEFFCEDGEYVLPGGTSAPLADVLDALGLSGTVDGVTCSDESLFSASKESGVWVVTARKPFTSTEWMEVVLDGAAYTVTVTDDIAAGTYDSVDWLITDGGQLQIGNQGGTAQGFATAAGSRAASDYTWHAYRDQIKSVTFVSPVSGNGSHSNMFLNYTNLESADMTNFITTNVTSLESMFEFCTSLTTVTNLTCSTSTTNLQDLFYQCTSLQTFDGSGLVTNNVTNMSWMFLYCRQLTTVIQPTGGWNTGKVTNMSLMFEGCSALTTLDVSGWNTGSVTNMNGLFWNCQSLTTLDVSGWNTGNVTNMYGMFLGCSNVAALDVSSWNTANVTDFTEMFSMCNSIKTLDIHSFNMTTATRTAMLESMAGLRAIILGAYCRLTDTGFDYEINTQIWSNDMTVAYTPAELIAAFDADPTGMAGEYDAVYTVTLAPGEGTGADVVTYTPILSGIYELSDPPAAFIPPANNVFYRWQYAGAEYKPGSTVSVSGNVSITALWAIGGTYDGVDWLITPATATPASQLQIGSQSGTAQTFTDRDTRLADDWPWLTYKTQITSAVFVATVNAGHAHSYMFAQCTAMTTADLTNFNMANGTNLYGMFFGCSTLQSVTHFTCSASATSLSSLFAQCAALTVFDGSLMNTQNVTTMADMFYGCHALATVTGIDGWNTGNVNTMSGMFQNCYAMGSLDLHNWNTSQVTNMADMFRMCHFSSLNVSGWTTSGVTNMNGMFFGSSTSAALDLSTWNTSSVTDMGDMFGDCGNLPSLNVSGWNTGNVTNMAYMFGGDAALTALDISSFNMGPAFAAGGISDMLSGLTGLTSITLGSNDRLTGTGFNTDTRTWSADMTTGYTAANLVAAFDDDPTSMAGTYQTVYTVTLDPGEGTGAPVTAYAAVSAGTYLLPAVPGTFSHPDGKTFNGWRDAADAEHNVGDAVTLTGDATFTAVWVFKGVYDGVDWLITPADATPANQLQIGSQSGTAQTFDYRGERIYSDYPWYDRRNEVTSVAFVAPVGGYGSHSGMFTGLSGAASADCSNFDTADVTDLSLFFQGCSSMTSVNLTGWNTSAVTAMYNLFYGCSGLTSLDLTGWNTAGVTNMSGMFSGCSGLTSLDLTGWDTSSVTNMGGMFRECSGLTSMDWLSGFDTSQVENMYGMFHSCTGMSDLSDIYGWDTSAVTDMRYLFYNSGVTALDLTGWDTSSATQMGAMFMSCANLQTADLSGWDTSHVTGMSSMFRFDDMLETLDLTGWDTSAATDMGGMFYGTGTADLDLDLSHFVTTAVTTMQDMFRDSGMGSVTIGAWDLTACTNISQMFMDSGLKTLDLSGWENTGGVTNMRFAFFSLDDLETLDLGGLTIGGTADKTYTISDLPALTELRLGAGTDITGSGFNSARTWSRDLVTPLTAAQVMTASAGGTAATYYAVFTVTFDANGGTGAMAPAVVRENAPNYTLPACGFTGPTGYVFLSWADYGDPGTAITLTADTTIKAAWHRVWNAPVWAWNGDSTAATVTFTCQNDPTGIFTQRLAAAVVSTNTATCETAGVATGNGTVTFLGVDYTDTHAVAVAALGHIWNDGVVTRQPTCTEVGVKTFTCTRDPSHTRTEDVERLPHIWDTIWHSDADGHWHICKVCGTENVRHEHISSGKPTEDLAEWCTACHYLLSPKLPYTSSVQFQNSGETTLPDLSYTQPGEQVRTYQIVLPADQPLSEHNWFEGWYSSIDEAMHEPGDVLTGTYGVQRQVVFSGVWTPVIGVGTYELEAGARYRFEEGVFMVSGDGTLYEGSQFFYPTAGGTTEITGGRPVGLLALALKGISDVLPEEGAAAS